MRVVGVILATLFAAGRLLSKQNVALFLTYPDGELDRQVFGGVKSLNRPNMN